MNYYFILVALCAFLSISAQEDSFAFRRSLKGIDSTWHRIELPPVVTGKLNSKKSDLRIYGVSTSHDTIEAPYVLSQKNALRVPKQQNNKIDLLNIATRDGHFFTTLYNPNNRVINFLNLKINAINFDYNVRISGSMDQKEWFTIKENNKIINIQNQYINYELSTLYHDPVKYTYIRLQFDNTDDVALQKVFYSHVNKQGLPTYKTLASRYTTVDNPKTNETVAILSLPYATTVDQLAIKFSTTNDFYRKITIQAQVDSTVTEKGVLYDYHQLYRGYVSSLEDNNVTFENDDITTQKIKLTIENNDDNPLKIKSLTAGHDPYVLRARIDDLSASYALFYGKAAVLKPNYDIVNFEQKIPEHLASLLLGEEQFMLNNDATEITSNTIFNNKLLWAVMLLIICLLAYFSYSMLKEKE
jgi:hypothetical protein